MRFNKDQVLFAVQFTLQSDIDDNRISMFSLPLRHDNNEMPVKINFIKLTVAEHHKVYSAWEDQSKGEPECDGFILKDDQGVRYFNQYPIASYSQTTDTCDRRFWRQPDEDGVEAQRKFVDFHKQNPQVPCEYNLLTDALESMYRGVKDLGEVKEDHPNYAVIKEKVTLLTQLIDRIKKEFTEAYPEYQIHLGFESFFAGSTFKHASARIYRRIDVEQALQMTEVDILKELNDNNAFEVVYPNGDVLCMEDGSGAYHLFGELTSVSHIKVYYGEKTVMEGEAGYLVCQTEFFNPKNKGQAVECFIRRMIGHHPHRHANLGTSLEHIASEQSIEHALRYKVEYFAKYLEPGKCWKVNLLGNITFAILALTSGGYALEYSKPTGLLEGDELRAVTTNVFPDVTAEIAVHAYKAFVKMIDETGFDPACINQEILLIVLERVRVSQAEEVK